MIPIIDGHPHRFVLTGVYDGLFVMRDVETSTLWNHITGEALYGPLLGRAMPVSNLLQTNVKQALALDPNIHVAISSRPFSGRGNRLDPNATLSDKFIGSLGSEDTRRPRMELGLGLSSGGKNRFYPMAAIQERGRAFFDVFNNRRVLIYIDPESFTPAALFVDAASAKMAGSEVRLADGRTIRSGLFFGRDGKPQPADRPLQNFTRWYGFALTFPGCEVFGAQEASRAEDEVLQAQTQRFKAMLAHDLTALESMFADELSYVHASGDLDTRSTYPAFLRTRRYLDISTEGAKVDVYGNAAVITDRLRMTVLNEGQKEARTLNLRSTEVYVKRNGRWLFAHFQATFLPTEQPANSQR